MRKKLEWFVWEYPHAWSGDEPYNPHTVNVFDHYKFSLELYRLKKKKLERKDFEEELGRILRYRFWCKCEYELLLFPWPDRDKDEGFKIDVYGQIVSNWQRFADYVWDNQKLIPKVEDYRKLSRKVEKYVDTNLKKKSEKKTTKKSPEKKTVKKTTKTKEPKNEER